MYVMSMNGLHIERSYDGTWMTGGHNSNYGVGFVRDTVTGIVLDFEVLSKIYVDYLTYEKYFRKDGEIFRT